MIIKLPTKIAFRKPDRKKLALFLWLCMSFILAAVRFVLNKIGITEGPLREVFLVLVTCLPYLFLAAEAFTSKKGIPRWGMVFIGLLSAVLIVMCLSLIFNPRLGEFYFRKEYGIGPALRPDGAIFAFLFFSLLDDSDDVRDVMLKAAYVLLIFQVVVIFWPSYQRGYWLDIAPDGSELHLRYSLSFGYDLIFPFAVFLSEGLKSRKLIHYALAVASFLMIVTNGGRGAIAVLALFVALLVFTWITDRKPMTFRKLLFFGLILAVCVFGLLFIDWILNFLSGFLSSHNINSRTLEMLVNGSFSASNGRDRIWNAVIEAIKKGGPFGYGLFGDRPFVSPIHVAGYSHNLFLELTVSFGVFGVAIAIYILCDAFRMIVFCRDENWRRIYLILFCASCKLFLSFSLWYAWEFWAAAAIAFKYKSLNRRPRAAAGGHAAKVIGSAEISEECERKEYM